MTQPAIKAVLETMLEGVSRRDLQARAHRMSELYRQGKGSSIAIRDEQDALAYTIARMPATSAAIGAASRYALDPRRLPASFRGVRTMLDLGAGPGTATFSAFSAAPLEHVTLVEKNPAFRTLASKFLRQLDVSFEIVDHGIERLPRALAAADLVVMGYVQVEMTMAAAKAAVLEAARLATSVVLLVEPGTPAGFERIRQARDVLLAAGLSPLAPCPGSMACPMSGSDWCHFSVRLQRSRDHKILKAGDAPFEDERFCYFAALKEPTSPASGRVLAEPEKTHRDITAKLCVPSGLEIRRFRRADKASYKQARALDWGDAIETVSS